MARLFCLLWIFASAFARGAGGEETDFKAVSMVFTDRLDQVALAITNGFADRRYHASKLIYLPCDFVMKNGSEVAVAITNTWLIHCESLPLTLLAKGKKWIAYNEDFRIKAEEVSSGGTKVSVKPAGSGTRDDSYALSMHGSLILGGNYYPPVPSETTNVFQRIERQLREFRAGRTNALPPTPDTKPGFYSDFWLSMDAKEKHDPRNWAKMVEAWKALQALEATNNGGESTHAIDGVNP